jgi:hypothetical protein
MTIRSYISIGFIIVCALIRAFGEAFESALLSLSGSRAGFCYANYLLFVKIIDFLFTVFPIFVRKAKVTAFDEAIVTTNYDILLTFSSNYFKIFAIF